MNNIAFTKDEKAIADAAINLLNTMVVHRQGHYYDDCLYATLSKELTRYLDAHGVTLKYDDRDGTWWYRESTLGDDIYKTICAYVEGGYGESPENACYDLESLSEAIEDVVTKRLDGGK